MTITCQPMDATSGAPAYSAQNERQNMSVLFGGGSGLALGARSGWRVGTPSNVLTVNATQWTLAPCSAVINPGAATAQGAYRWSTDSNVTAANNLNAADATNTRIDIVYIQINDSSSGDGSGALTAPVLYAAGVPSATPTAPALPPRSFLVGTITVPKVNGGTPTVVTNPAIFVASGGILPVATQAERDALTQSVGLAVSRADLNGLIEVSNGTTWLSSVKRRHAEFTGTANTTGGAAWGLGVLTETTGAKFNNTFATPGPASKLTLTEAGCYSVTIKVGSSSAPGFFYVSIKNDADNNTFADGNNGGSIDWGATTSIPNLLIVNANTNILFGLRTANSVAVTATITVQKISD